MYGKREKDLEEDRKEKNVMDKVDWISTKKGKIKVKRNYLYETMK